MGSDSKARGRRRAANRRSRVRPLLAVIASIAVLAGGVTLMLPKVLAQFQGAPDFSGTPGPVVQIEVFEGETLAQIGNALKAKGVVASVDAFTQAASANPNSQRIAPGIYQLKSRIPASSAVDALLNPASKITKKVVIPEGKRASWVLDTLVAATGIPLTDFEAAIKQPKTIDLPDYANGKVEGFLFPATYEFAPTASATTILKTMVDKYLDVTDALGLDAAAKGMGFTSYQILTIASLLEVEGHPRDFDRVARVVYNRLASGMRLQFDSTVNYGLGRADVMLTQKQLDKKTAYNTYLNDGLPPTPIDNPGEAAIKAALNPVDGDWIYFITVNLATQETKFTKSYDEFLGYKDQFLAYCKANPGTC